MGMEEKFARNIVKTRYEDLPKEAVDYAKKSVLDTIGAAIAGSAEPGCVELIELIKSWGGRRQATIWVYGGRAPVHLAALAAGPMARAKELGDFHRRGGGVHASEYIVPAALPMTEYLGEVSGKDLITAIALGQDIMARMGIVVGIPTTVLGRITVTRVLGPVTACAKLLGLDQEQVHNALGIAYSSGFCPIDMQQYIDGSMTSYLHYGFCAEGGVKAALLARKGVKGTHNFLEGRWGYFSRVEPQHLDLAIATQDLGKVFEGAYLSTKPYPACACTHVSIDVVLDLVKSNNIKPQDIAEIYLKVADPDYQMAVLPIEERVHPSNVVSARMSIPYVVAVAAATKSLSLEDFMPEALERPAVREIAGKVKAEVDPALSAKEPGGPVIARIRTKGGKEFTKRLDQCKGHPENPLTFEEVADLKFRKCLPFAARPIPAAQADEIVELVATLEKVRDVGRIAKLLA